MKKFFGCLIIAVTVWGCRPEKDTIEQRVDDLLKKMTLDEKIGQLNQLNGDWEATGPVTPDIQDKMQAIREGKIGSILNIMGVEHTRKFQEAAMQSRLKIPLLFGQDVIHGYYVTFPIPLAEAASWDTTAIEMSARIAATEAAASGIHWTFAPMVDIARDPRWGRVMEGAGEDPYLGSVIARARVRGFQGKGFGQTDAVMACAKHFAAYGAAIGGRDYNSVDMSLRTLWEVYLPPFKAAKDAGVATFMNSFNDINGIPATGNHYIQREILKDKWQFKGFVVSDWGSIGEMIPHGYVKNTYEAAETAIMAGNDMDMESRCYTENLARLVADKKVPVSVIDEAVRRILRKKFEMGLFDDPFKFSNPEREKETINKSEFHGAARDIARKSIVLLKNDGHLLPLTGKRSIALIGPLVKAEKVLKGFWSIDLSTEADITSLFEGISARAGNTRIAYAEGCGIQDSSRAGFTEAVNAARQSDVVIMAMGEEADMTGEAKSKANIHLPGIQEDLIKTIVATGKPVVVILLAGRPMVFDWTASHVPAILYAWWPGDEGGNAIADVVFGKYNPSGKLPITFPRAEGQIPIYYNYMNTGRPASNEKDLFYKSAYIDLLNSPQFAFGHGLSYTTFEYSNLHLSSSEIHKQDVISVTLNIKNTGTFDGEETVQLYLRDLVAQPLRPVKELKDFRKVMLKAGENTTLTFKIDISKLSFYDENLNWISQPGEFDLMIGSASDDIRLSGKFTLAD